MKRCQKDCLHYHVCERWCLAMNAEECEDFKDKEKWVEQKRGHWIEKKLDNFRMWELRCSECDWVGVSNYDAYNEPYDFNYCPNCGADMRGEEDA